MVSLGDNDSGWASPVGEGGAGKLWSRAPSSPVQDLLVFQFVVTLLLFALETCSSVVVVTAVAVPDGSVHGCGGHGGGIVWISSCQQFGTLQLRQLR